MSIYTWLNVLFLRLYLPHLLSHVLNCLVRHVEDDLSAVFDHPFECAESRPMLLLRLSMREVNTTRTRSSVFTTWRE